MVSSAAFEGVSVSVSVSVRVSVSESESVSVSASESVSLSASERVRGCQHPGGAAVDGEERDGIGALWALWFRVKGSV